MNLHTMDIEQLKRHAQTELSNYYYQTHSDGAYDAQKANDHRKNYSDATEELEARGFTCEQCPNTLKLLFTEEANHG